MQGMDKEEEELRECESCHQKKTDVKLRRDPYRWEVHNESVYRYLCVDCLETRRGDI